MHHRGLIGTRSRQQVHGHEWSRSCPMKAGRPTGSRVAWIDDRQIVIVQDPIIVVAHGVVHNILGAEIPVHDSRFFVEFSMA